MLQAFIVVLREGFEAFLIVAITIAYLRKTGQQNLIKAAFWGIGAGVLASAALGYAFWQAPSGMPIWEAVFGLITVILVSTLVVHMWKTGSKLKEDIENKLSQASKKESFWGVFIFTVIMISREGMETVLLLIQIQEPSITTGIFLGVLAAAAMALLWQQFGYLINLKHFFQVTSVYLILFIVLVAVQTFHELTEAGIWPNSDYWHHASEPYSLEGTYGKAASMSLVVGCGLWLVGSWIFERFSKSKATT